MDTGYTLKISGCKGGNNPENTQGGAGKTFRMRRLGHACRLGKETKREGNEEVRGRETKSSRKLRSGQNKDN